MDLLLLVVVLCLVGFVIYVATTKIPMPPGWATTIQIGALLVLLLYVVTRLVEIPNVLP